MSDPPSEADEGADDQPMDGNRTGSSLVDQDDDSEEEDEVGDEEDEVGFIEDEDDDDENDPLGHLSPEVRACIQDLKVLDAQRNDQISNYLSERAALERKYAERMQPLYDQRRAVVPQIPQFWACALTNNDTSAEWINEDDIKALEHLTDITKQDREDGKGFTLKFHFRENDYFSNTILSKTYHIPNLLLSDEPSIKQVIGDTIHWKPGKSLTHRNVIRKQRGKGKHAGRIRTVTKQEELESFFTWFSPPPMPENAEEMDEEEANRLDEIFDLDYELAQAIRSEIIPQAVLWFTDEANQEIGEDFDMHVLAA